MRRVEKAFSYITHGKRLLVFRHVRSPEAGIQVPAGTIEPDESPEQAALREATEETGLRELSIEAKLGTRDFDMSPFGRTESHHRHFFHLTVGGSPPDQWQHEERERSDGGLGSIPFEFFWVRLPDAVPDLIADHGALLHLLDV